MKLPTPTDFLLSIFGRPERLLLLAAALLVANAGSFQATPSGWLLAAVWMFAAWSLITLVLVRRVDRGLNSWFGRNYPRLAIAMLAPTPIFATAAVGEMGRACS